MSDDAIDYAKVYAYQEYRRNRKLYAYNVSIPLRRNFASANLVKLEELEKKYPDFEKTYNKELD